MFRLDPGTASSLLKNCSTLRTLKSVHASVLKSYQLLDLFFSTNLVSKYATLGSVSYAFTLFSLTTSTDIFLWNVIIRAFAENGPFDQSIKLYYDMQKHGVIPDNFTFPFVLKACANLGDVEEGKKIHNDAKRLGYESDVFVGNSLIAFYGKCDRVNVAHRLFVEMPEKNVVTWSALINGYSQNGYFEEGLSLFYQMLSEKIEPNPVSILGVIPCIKTVEEADGIYEIIKENGLEFDNRIRNAIICMYAKCGQVTIAENLFNSMMEKDFVSWASMIDAYVRVDQPMKSLELFKIMKIQKIHIDYVTLLNVAQAISNIGSLLLARFIHGFMVRNMVEELVLETALVDLYVKCGSLKNARKMFDRMPNRNLVTWSTMISGYGMHGQGKEALQLFNRMKVTTKPDHIAFVAVLSACSHAGLISEGWECFNSISRDFNLNPCSEHYACMVDLLGRSGKLNEAYKFIQQIPMKPDSGIWGSLLGACRIHSNVELAELAAKSLFELDPNNPGRYVLLSNIYLASGKRKEANGVRALMKRRGVKKNPGYTTIELKNRVCKFLAGDQSHPQTALIYQELEKLMARIQEEGYVPDTNFVFHDVEEETKEKMVYVHSEKLAIVFGLLNLKPGQEIRIRKNLRVCGDCHTATKFISKVTQREIIVRDSLRFHHFKGGSCSCCDYW